MKLIISHCFINFTINYFIFINVNSSDLDMEISNPRCNYYKVYQNIQYPKALNLSVEMCAGEMYKNKECLHPFRQRAYIRFW